MLRIRLDCWNPEPVTVTEQTKWGKEYTYKYHESAGSVVTEIKSDDVEIAKNRARELWKEYYNGAMKRIQIFQGRELVYEFDGFKSKV